MKISITSAVTFPLLFFTPVVVGKNDNIASERGMMANPFYGVENPKTEFIEVQNGNAIQVDCMEFGEKDTTSPIMRMTDEQLSQKEYIPQTGIIYIYPEGEDPDCIPKTIALSLELDRYRLDKDGTLFDEEDEEILLFTRPRGYKVIQDDPKGEEEDNLNPSDGGGRKLASPTPLVWILWHPDLVWKGAPCWKSGFTANTKAWTEDANEFYTNVDHIRTFAWNMALDQDLCSNCHVEASSMKHVKGCWSSGCAFAPWNEVTFYEGTMVATYVYFWFISSGCW